MATEKEDHEMDEVHFTDREIKALKRVAQKEEAWNVVGSSVKGIMIWVAAISSGFYVTWDWIKNIIKAAVQ